MLTWLGARSVHSLHDWGSRLWYSDVLLADWPCDSLSAIVTGSLKVCVVNTVRTEYGRWQYPSLWALGVMACSVASIIHYSPGPVPRRQGLDQQPKKFQSRDEHVWLGLTEIPLHS